MIYGVLISVDGQGYGAKVGWDDAYRSRAEAEACARRAANQPGWAAKVVEMSDKEAAANGWTVIRVLTVGGLPQRI